MSQEAAQIIGIFALGMLFGVCLLLRLVAPTARRESTAVTARSPRPNAPQVQVSGTRDRGSRAVVSPANENDLDARLRQEAAACTRHDDDETPRAIVGAEDQINDFVGFMLREGYAGRFQAKDWVKSYRAWAAHARIINVLPESIFLSLFYRHRNVERKRGQRLKDRDGNIVRLESGTPVRPIFYTLHEKPLVVVPAGVTAPQKASSTRYGAKRVQGGQRRKAA